MAKVDRYRRSGFAKFAAQLSECRRRSRRSDTLKHQPDFAERFRDAVLESKTGTALMPQMTLALCLLAAGLSSITPMICIPDWKENWAGTLHTSQYRPQCEAVSVERRHLAAAFAPGTHRRASYQVAIQMRPLTQIAFESARAPFAERASLFANATIEGVATRLDLDAEAIIEEGKYLSADEKRRATQFWSSRDRGRS